MKRQVKVSVGRSVGYSVSESVGEAAAAAAGGSGLLDTYTGAVMAYSTARRLRDAYAGALFRVRRSSDNAEQDIGFDAGTGLVDQAALTTFVGANSGYVVTFYDQTGNGRHCTNATASLQPIMVNAGVLVTLGTNAYPVFQFDDTDDYLASAAVDLTSIDAGSLYTAASKSSDVSNGNVFAFTTTTTPSNGSFAIWAPFSAAGTTINHKAKGTADPASISRTLAAPASFVAAAKFNILAAARALRVNNGTPITSGNSLGTGNLGNHPLYIGALAGSTGFLAGTVGEILIFSQTTQYDAGTNIDANMMTFWGIS